MDALYRKATSRVARAWLTELYMMQQRAARECEIYKIIELVFNDWNTEFK